jgi:hypothetical protein
LMRRAVKSAEGALIVVQSLRVLANWACQEPGNLRRPPPPRGGRRAASASGKLRRASSRPGMPRSRPARLIFSLAYRKSERTIEACHAAWGRSPCSANPLDDPESSRSRHREKLQPLHPVFEAVSDRVRTRAVRESSDTRVRPAARRCSLALASGQAPCGDDNGHDGREGGRRAVLQRGLRVAGKRSCVRARARRRRRGLFAFGPRREGAPGILPLQQGDCPACPVRCPSASARGLFQGAGGAGQHSSCPSCSLRQRGSRRRVIPYCY